MKYHLMLVLTVAMVLLTWPSPAKAYLDPGTGSMVLQIAIGGTLAVLATVRIYWQKLKSLFRGKSGSDVSTDSVGKASGAD